MRQDHEFVSEYGVVLRGWLYAPDDGDGPFPAVVLTHGFGAVKEQFTDTIAERLCAAGTAVLLYDQPCFGASDGTPRQEVDPWRQIAGYRDAITYLHTLDEIDSNRIGIAGTSYAGGHVLVVGAMDRRVRAVYSQVPLISGGASFARFVRADQVPDVRAMFDADRLARFTGADAGTIPLTGDDPAAMVALAGRETWDWYQSIEPERLATWRNEVTVRSMEMLSTYEPGDYIGRISPTPLMLAVASHDVLASSDLAFDAYERARHPKQLVVLPGGHFVAYGPEFETTIRAMTEFFTTELAPRSGS